MANAHQAIKAVARRTGLSAQVIRIWEKRYGVVKPKRTRTNRRLYSDEQIERLSLLRQITQNGHNIGHVAKLPIEKLRKLSQESHSARKPASRSLNATFPASNLMDKCITAIKSLDSNALHETLKYATVEMGTQGLLQRIVAPLTQKIGELWREGILSVSHEHFATAIIRTFLGQATKPFGGTQGAPNLIVGTPPGQIHELGALLVGAAATNVGWHVTYLGASVPAVEIAGAARQNHSRAVALSLVYPEDDPLLEDELRRLCELLPSEVTLLIGGRAAAAYSSVLKKMGALQMKDLSHLCLTLDQLRKPLTKKKRQK